MPDRAPTALPPAGLPTGAKDVLPVEAAQLRAVERGLIGQIVGFGYREVILPALELAEVIDRAQEGGVARAFRLFDDHGRVLLLRPDLTIPVSRLIATRLADDPGPVRLWYSARRFRRPAAGRPAPIEDWQVGVELAGDPAPEADAEVLGILGACLRGVGLGGARIAVGDLGVVHAVMDAAGVDATERRALEEAAAARDVVGWCAIVQTLALPDAQARLLADLPTLRGGVEILDRVESVRGATCDACTRLRRTLSLLPGHGMDTPPLIDLGLFRDWPYYTGILIEAYADGVGVPVAAGGRYDTLAERFGRARPSAGFSIDLDLLHRALRHAGVDGERGRVGIVAVDGGDTLLSEATAARRAGHVVVAVPDPDRARALAAANGWRYLARRDGADILVEDLRAGDTVRVASLVDLPTDERP